MKTVASLLTAALLISACASQPLDSASVAGGGSSGEPSEPSAGKSGSGGAASADCLGDGVSDLGEPCPCVSDCRAGLYCLPEADTGYPQNECMLPCTEDATCPTEDGWYCFKFEDTDPTGLCTQHCKTSNDCTSPDRHWCTGGDCFGQCQRDDQCLSGHCNPGTFYCDDGTPNGDAPLLASCLRDQDCASGKCAGTPLTCTMFCPDDRDVCPDGTACRGNKCYPLCEAAADCPKPYQCDTYADDASGAMVCAFRERDQTCTGVTSHVGEPCGCDDDCADGLPCQAPNSRVNILPLGLCVMRCDMFDEGTGLKCPTGLHCTTSLDPDPSTHNDGVCVASCDSPSDCKAGRICSTEQGCEPFCQSDADCAGTRSTPTGEDKKCNLYLGDCLSFTPTGKTLGQKCAGSGDCMSGHCISGDGKSFFCSAQCSIVGQKCPDHGVCIDNGDNDMGLCVPSCTVSTDCPSGTTCVKGACVKG